MKGIARLIDGAVEAVEAIGVQLEIWSVGAIVFWEGLEVDIQLFSKLSKIVRS